MSQATLLPAISPYMDVTMAIVVPDHEKRNFQSREHILKLPDPVFAVIKGSFFAERIARIFPDTKLLPLDSASEYFDGKYNEADGLIIRPEIGSPPGHCCIRNLRLPIRCKAASTSRSTI